MRRINPARLHRWTVGLMECLDSATKPKGEKMEKKIISHIAIQFETDNEWYLNPHVLGQPFAISQTISRVAGRIREKDFDLDEAHPIRDGNGEQVGWFFLHTKLDQSE